MLPGPPSIVTDLGFSPLSYRVFNNSLVYSATTTALKDSEVSSYATTCFQRTFRPQTKNVKACVASKSSGFLLFASFDAGSDCGDFGADSSDFLTFDSDCIRFIAGLF